MENVQIKAIDERRELLMAGNQLATLDFCARHFVSTAQQAIQDHGAFFVALAGGSTPKTVYEKVTSSPYAEMIDWKKVHLFFGDERSVPPDDPDNNYHMAMEAGFSKVPIPQTQIHRMVAESDIEDHANQYEGTIKENLNNQPFDLVILGMGEDAHTASLFPQTEGLRAQDRLVVANYIPQKNTWRMTLTFEAINAAKNIVIYVIGEKKKETFTEFLKADFQPERYPIQVIGTKEHKVLFIADEAAAPSL